MIVALENLAQDAETTSQHGLDYLRSRLTAIETTLAERPRWLTSALVRAALARAAAQLDLFESATAHYEALLAAGKANFTVEALEQLENLRSRWAVHRWRNPGDGGPPELESLRSQIAASVRTLEHLPKGDAMPAERRALIGSAYKRLSQLARNPEERLDALKKMARAYKRAHEQGLRERGRVDTYPLHNWLGAELMLRYLGGNGRRLPIEDLLAGGELATLEDEAGDPTFWTSVARADAQLIHHLAAADLSAHVPEIVQAYRDAWDRGGAPKQLRSVAEHLEWLIDCLTVSPPAARASAAAKKRAESCLAMAAALRTVLGGVRGFVQETSRSSA